MTFAHSDELVAAYLRRLEQAAAPLTRSRRTELLAEIREHIDDALFEADATDEVAVRNVLERIGPPEEIASAAGPLAVAPTGSAGKLEVAGLIALALPFAGWLVGIPLVLLSQAWSRRDKWIGVLLSLTPLLGGLLVTMVGADNGADVPVGTPHEPSNDGLGPLEITVLIGAVLGGLVGSAYLAFRLRQTGQPRALEA